MEAGNRCWDTIVPEEKNRRIIDAISTVNMPYTHGSATNLLREGIAPGRIHVIGNPIQEVLNYYGKQIVESTILDILNLECGKFIITTAHREENVDDQYRLNEIFKALEEISQEYPVIFSCHPRTKQNLVKFGIHPASSIRVCEPFGFFDFVKLESSCLMGITDSGTVQEELCLLGKPAITIRDTTERPETVECGSNIVTGVAAKAILTAFRRNCGIDAVWSPPVDYLKSNVSDTVVNIILGEI